MSEAETQEWLEQLHSIKTANLNRITSWLRELALSKQKDPLLKLSLPDASFFMMAINDYRLMMAARCNIGEQEMTIRSMDDLLKLPAARREGLFEVHFLAWLMEEILGTL